MGLRARFHVVLFPHKIAVVSCDLHGISIWHYLRDTYQRLADGWSQSRLGELTPAAWAAAQHEARQP